MAPKIDVAFLQSRALFGGVTDDGIRKIIPYLEEKSFATGDFIIREGSSGTNLYLITEGSVEVLKSRGSGDDLDPMLSRIAVLKTGDTFGEMALIDIQPRSAMVRALEPVKALALSNASLYHLYQDDIHTYTMIILNLARELSRRLRLMDELLACALYHR